eukprot:1983930-Pyramimonas_sp.AAC.1
MARHALEHRGCPNKCSRPRACTGTPRSPREVAIEGGIGAVLVHDQIWSKSRCLCSEPGMASHCARHRLMQLTMF